MLAPSIARRDVVWCRPFVLALCILLISCGDGVVGPAPKTPGVVRIAFIADQGWEPSRQYDGPRAVLRLIREEGADAVFHQGDFDYGQNPEAWINMIDEELGQDFPYFASVGNHELDGTAWGQEGGYRDRLEDRASRLGYTWTGIYGEQASLSFEGIRVLLGSPGIFPNIENSTYANYFAGELATDTATWRICSWHKNQRQMQVGGKSDEVGYAVYEACRVGGAIIATGHEHSYSRTHLLSDISEQIVASRSDTLELSEGRAPCLAPREEVLWNLVPAVEQCLDFAPKVRVIAAALFEEPLPFAGRQVDRCLEELFDIVRLAPGHGRSLLRLRWIQLAENPRPDVGPVATDRSQRDAECVRSLLFGEANVKA